MTNEHKRGRTLVECLSDPDWVKDNHDQAGFHAVQEIKRLEEQRDELAEALNILQRWSTPFIENTPISAETLWREFPDAIKHARYTLAKLEAKP